MVHVGGTIVGKSTCENQCLSANSFTSASGPVPNPHDITRSAGGSSSGSAVLVATGEVDMAIGGDQGGSIRMPSCWSGCVGLKATFGLVPVTGSLGLEPSFDHLGPMASNVTDVAKLLEVIAGYDDGRDHRQNPHVVIPKYSQLLTGDLAGVKFGYVKEGSRRASDGVKSVMSHVITKLRESGAVVEEVSIPLHAQSDVLMTALIPAYYDCMFENFSQSPGFNELYNVSALRHFKQAMQGSAHDLVPIAKTYPLFREYIRKKDGSQIVARAMNCRPTLRKAYNDVLEKYDALIMPTIPFVAVKLPPLDLTPKEFIDEVGQFKNINTAPFNLTGHPALSLNVGKVQPDDGGTNSLPVGLQIVCKHFEEAKLLDIAYGVEKLMI
ncbi:hypothetical protein EB796_016592 [Bugula neritina]|uniref:Amidase domain-containing protein n=1 Tax=Bugula neritina TaxID=10212 RepID=A0A7J7JH36_BUGNE|nr:hypothetical protein EB796_016592 [Bugula neritina]